MLMVGVGAHIIHVERNGIKNVIIDTLFFRVALICFFLTLLMQPFLGFQLSYYERVHVSFQKSIAFAGDTLRYKAYIFSTNEKLKSKNLFIDVYDDKGEFLSHLCYPIINSTSTGIFILSNEYKGTKIFFKAYTTWQYHFIDTHYIHVNTIPVYQSDKFNETNYYYNKPLYHVSLLAENGIFTKGLTNRLFVKCNSELRKPIANFKGKLYYKDEIIDSFTTNKHGIATILFKPIYSKGYYISYQQLDKHKIDIPILISDSLDMSLIADVVHDKKIVNVRLETKPQLSSSKEDTFQMEVVANGFLLYKASISHATFSKNNMLTANIPLLNVPTSIVIIYIKNKDGNAILERPVFYYNSDFNPEVEVVYADINTKPFGKNKIVLKIKDTSKYNLSCRITHQTHFPQNNKHHKIQNSFWSEQSITNNLNYKKLDLDDLLFLSYMPLEYKYRVKKIILFNPLGGEWFKDSFLYIIGQVNFKRKYLLNTTKKNLSMVLENQRDKKKQTFLNIPILKNATFNTPEFIAYGRINIFPIFQAKGNSYFKNKSNKIILRRNLFKHPIQKRIHPKLYLYSTKKYDTTNRKNTSDQRIYHTIDSFFKLKKAKQLEEVIVKGTRNTYKELDKKFNVYNSGNMKDIVGSWEINVEVKEEDFHKFSSLKLFLLQQLPLKEVQNNEITSPKLEFYAKPLRENMRIIIDNVVFEEDFSILSNMSLYDVEYIKAYPSDNAIFIYTKTGTISKEGNSKQYSIYGYDYPSQRYVSKQYDYALFWNPNIIADSAQSTIEMVFSNNAIASNYELVLEGMSNDNKLIYFKNVFGD